jgi:hypothetical protein
LCKGGDQSENWEHEAASSLGRASLVEVVLFYDAVVRVWGHVRQKDRQKKKRQEKDRHHSKTLSAIGSFPVPDTRTMLIPRRLALLSANRPRYFTMCPYFSG